MVSLDITERVVSFLGIPATQSASWVNSSFEYDYAIGGVPFLSAANDRTPYLRKPYSRGLAPIRREQVDQQVSPGEQSLSGWWLRSQTNFTGGAGIRFFEPATDDRIMRRFRDSLGVDCWTTGELSMLNVATATSATATSGRSFPISTGSTVYYVYGSTSPVINRSGTTTALTGTSSVLSVTDDGTNFYRLTTAGLYKGLVASGGDAAYYTTTPSAGVVAWVKSRLMAGLDRSLYELTGTGAPTLPTALFTHPNTGWRWVSICDGPAAIYAAGYAGNRSAIYKFTLDSALSGSSLPALTQGTIIAELPAGEVINSIGTYLGRYMGICTSKGFRIASIDGNGDITYGPLIWSDYASYSVYGDDRFFYVGTTLASGPGLIRVDLSDPVADGRFPYATDLQTYASTGTAAVGGSGYVTSITSIGTSTLKTFCTFDGSSSYQVQESTSKVPTAWFRAGQTRYSTLEPKHFQLVNARWDTPMSGTLAISSIDESLDETSIITVTSAVTSQDFTFPDQGGAVSAGVRFDFTRDTTDATLGPVMHGWQFKAVPAMPRKEVVEIPLICTDFQRDRYDTQTGYEGFALDRYALIRDTIKDGSVVTFQDLSMNESIQVVIEDLQFEQVGPPGINSGFGGILTVQMREV